MLSLFNKSFPRLSLSSERLINDLISRRNDLVCRRKDSLTRQNELLYGRNE